MKRDNIYEKEFTPSSVERNFGIYIVDLGSGTANPMRIDEYAKDEIPARLLKWDELMRTYLKKRIGKKYHAELEDRFSLEALRDNEVSGEQKTEMLCQWHGNEGSRYVSVAVYFGREQGMKGYAVLSLMDLDALVRSEVAHMQHDAQMAAIIKSRYAIMNTIDLETGQCERVYLNSEAGTPKVRTGDYEEYIKKAVDGIVYAEDADKFLGVMSLGHIRERAKETENAFDEICEYRLKGETVRWVKQHIFYIRQGVNVLVNILGRDITKEKEKEYEIQKSTQIRGDIIRSLSGMFSTTYYIDLENDMYRGVTKQWEVKEVLGNLVNYTEAIHTYAELEIHPDDRKKYLETLSSRNLIKTLRRERPYVAVEYRRYSKDVIDPDGDFEGYGWMRVTAVLAQTDAEGRPKTALYAAQNVTDIKLREAKEHKALKDACEAANHANAAKNEFLSRMSHDIRTPMNGIIGMTTLAASHAEDKYKVLDCLDKIAVSAKHLLSLMNEVLDLSWIESGEAGLEEEPFNISDMLGKLIESLEAPIRSKGHEIKFYPVQAESEEVIGDIKKLMQIFTNILDNAIKYTPDNGLIELQVIQKESMKYGYGCYDFIIKDNGIGMEKTFIEHIFEPFSREEDSRISRIAGTGLGMTIVQNIVRMMGGNISVSSEVGTGSTFTLTLFLRLQDAQPASEMSEDEDFDIYFEGFRVLLVDDIEINREIAAEVIGSTGASVECAVDGKDALDCFAGHEEGYYDIIFMDIQMPVMNGYEAAVAIRGLDRCDAAQVPIIALSANAYVDDIAASRDAGMNAHMAKPLDFAQLAKCMKEWLRP